MQVANIFALHSQTIIQIQKFVKLWRILLPRHNGHGGYCGKTGGDVVCQIGENHESAKLKRFQRGYCKMNYYVYRLIDPRNGETFYVGKGKGNRVFQHMKGAWIRGK